MKILAIETSCDDTCVATAKCATGSKNKSSSDFELLSNIISSQIKIHQKWGGVYPTLARREHQRNLVPVLKKSLQEAGLLTTIKDNRRERAMLSAKKQKLKKILEREKNLFPKANNFLNKYQKPDIDLIAVTIGPGLDPCLWTGVNLAKALAYYWGLPVLGINHIEAHIFASWLGQDESDTQTISTAKQKIFPAVALVVSGGHTQLILVKKPGFYKIIGETRDDAAGEAFDKIARTLGLKYPGGPAIAQQAEQFKKINKKPKLNIELPRPMLYSKNYDFSFSGLKTAVLYDYKKASKPISQQYVQEMSYCTQEAVIDVLIKKTIKAAKDFRAKSIILGGGVTANKELRRQIKEKIKKESLPYSVFFPKNIFSTDNAAMIAITACSKINQGLSFKSLKNWQKIKALPNLRL